MNSNRYEIVTRGILHSCLFFATLPVSTVERKPQEAVSPLARSSTGSEDDGPHSPIRDKTNTATIPAPIPITAFFERTATRTVRPRARVRKLNVTGAGAPLASPYHTKLAMIEYESN
jgi:hypothetical protein